MARQRNGVVHSSKPPPQVMEELSMRIKRERIEVLIGREWFKCRIANKLPHGWVEFRLSDGTQGIRGPRKWRIAETKKRD